MMSSPDGMPRSHSLDVASVQARPTRPSPSFCCVAFGFSLLSALPDALLALWLKLLADGVVAHNRALAIAAAIGLGASATATWFLRVVSDRTQRRFRDRLTIALESHVAQLQASVATIEHHERPDYLNRLAVLRNQVFVLDHMYMSLFSTCGWILRLGVTWRCSMSVHPALALLAVFALPTVLHRRGGRGSSAPPRNGRAGQPARPPPVRHGHDGAARQGGARHCESAIGSLTDRRVAWERWYGPVAARSAQRGLWNTLAWAIFGVGFRRRPSRSSPRWCTASPGKVLLVLAAGSRLSAYIGATVGEIGFLRGIWLDGPAAWPGSRTTPRP